MNSYFWCSVSMSKIFGSLWGIWQTSTLSVVNSYKCSIKSDGGYKTEIWFCVLFLAGILTRKSVCCVERSAIAFSIQTSAERPSSPF